MSDDLTEFTPQQIEQMKRAADEMTEAFARAAQLGPDLAARDWLVELPDYDAEGVVIDKMVITEAAANIDKLKAAFNPQRTDRSVDAGTYTRLTVDGQVWMTDTPAEVHDHMVVDEQLERWERPTLLVAGLGIGLVVHRAITWHATERIDVVEIDPRVIRAVGPHYQQLADDHGVELNIHESDVHDWRAPRGGAWDVAWFDIWPTINDDDMLEVRRLRSRFRKRVGWSGAWAQDERRAMRKRIASGRWAY